MFSLCEFNSTHVDRTFEWLQESDLRRLFLFRRNLTRTAHEEWFRRYLCSESEQIWAILYNEEHVGNVGLKGIESQDAETWIYLGSNSSRGRGLGKSAYSLVHSLARSQFRLEELYCYIASFNEPSARLYRALGYAVDLSYGPRSRSYKGEAYLLNRFRKRLANPQPSGGATCDELCY